MVWIIYYLFIYQVAFPTLLPRYIFLPLHSFPSTIRLPSSKLEYVSDGLSSSTCPVIAPTKFYLPACLVIAVQLPVLQGSARRQEPLLLYNSLPLSTISLFFSFHNRKCFLICVQNIPTAVMGCLALPGHLLYSCPLFHGDQGSRATPQPVSQRDCCKDRKVSHRL